MTRAADFPAELEEWWDDFARSLRRRGRSDRTVGLYRQCFDRFWRWALDTAIDPDPATITATVVNAYTDKLIASGLAPTSVSIQWRNLRPFFAWWSKETERPNPFAGADVPGTGDEAPIPVIDLADVRKLLAACSGRDFTSRRDEAIFRILFDTGCRLGELVALDLGDWDRRSDFLTLRGKTGTRVVPVSPSTGEALARYVRARAAHPKHDLDALWLGPRGRVKASGVAQLLERRCREAGLPRLNPHRFRHTFAHEFRAQGGSEGDLMYLAGWSSTAMAHRYGKSAAASRARDTHRRLAPGDRL